MGVERFLPRRLDWEDLLWNLLVERPSDPHEGAIRSSASGVRVVTPEEFFACAALPQGKREQKKQKGGLLAGFLLK